MFIFSVIILLVIVAIIGFFLELTEKNITLQKLHDKVDEEQKKGAALQVLSETDRMTGLNDRVSGERKVTELIAAGHGGMFMELDIDHFKAINDTFGHQTGDIVVHAVADALKSAFRTNDVIMRLGGDEFVVFAVGIASREMGESVVYRFFSRVNNLVIPELRGEKVCISVGAVITPDHGSLSFHDLYGIADKALYTSKKASGSSLTFGEGDNL
jgi:diguanylate cyclase (GGDEF)-like protein